MNRPALSLGRIALTLAIGAPAILAQGVQTGNINGTVTIKGAPAAGVSVRLSSPNLQVPRTMVTDSDGRFAGRLLPPGAYTIEVIKDGFQTIKTVQYVRLGQTLEIPCQLAPVGGTVVEVVAGAAEVDRTEVRSAQTYVLDNVDSLPTGRTMEAVAFLTPGVTSGVGSRPSIRGSMTSGSLYLMDGQNISDNAYNNRGVRMIDDSIEEIQIITGALSAEYGDTDGGVLNAITRSGGNEFKGQLRWELNNPQWNAYQPLQNRTALSNRLSEEKTLSLSGFIIKDKLWFSGSFFNTAQNGTGTINANIPVRTYTGTWGDYTTGNAPTGYNSPYDTYRKELRRQFKLTYSLNQDHMIVASFNNSRIDEINRNYSAGELLSLIPQVSTSEFMNLTWRAIWGTAWTTEFKVGRKKQFYGAGGADNGQSPIYNYNIGYYYNNGIFSNTDGGDNRNNQTINFKASVAWTGMGSHETVMGFDYYKGTSRARNEQSPTNLIFGVQRMNLATRQAYGTDVWTYFSGDGEANNFSQALFVNDKWALGQGVALSLGVRFDSFKAQREDGGRSAGASGISPRLGVIWDVKQDGKFVANLAFNRYNSKVLEGITNAVTNQGNPTEIDHPYIGPAGPQSFAFLSNPATLRTLYDFSTISWYNNPTVNVRLSDNLKAPVVDELQGSFKWAFSDADFGNGYIKVTGVTKKWTNLLDYRVGRDGQVPLADGSSAYWRVWENSDAAERNYKALEIDSQLTKGAWALMANVTWSQLRGNYVGELSNSPAAGQGLKNFTVQDGRVMYDGNVTNPIGFLPGHVPMIAKVMLNYTDNNAYGKTVWGVIYSFTKGGRFSITRNVDPTDLNPNISSQYGTTATQYLGERGAGGSWNSSCYVDLAVTHTFNLFKVVGRQVEGFVKLNIGNVLNHQQQLTWNVTYADSLGAGLGAPFTPADPATFGLATGNGNYGTARTIAISTGFRF
jgi:hypothetical protein